MNARRTCREIQNESGIFIVDPDGYLLDFSEDPDNRVDRGGYLPGGYRRCVWHLHIPEGVRFIGVPSAGRSTDSLRNLLAAGEITLPRSLIAVGHSAFSESFIGEITFPGSLRKIGRGSFMHCLILRLNLRKEVLQYDDADPDEKILADVPENRLLFGGRSFKESVVRDVAVPGTDLAEYVPACRSTGLNHGLPEFRKLPAQAWIKRLMPETSVLRITGPQAGN